MKSYLNIKASKLWMLGALAVLGVVITCCSVSITSVEQPSTAIAGDSITVKIHVAMGDPVNEVDGAYQANYIVCILAPKGWKIGDNTRITYTSNKGSGLMRRMPDDVLEPTQQANGLNWPASAKQKFGIGGNLIDDVEWVVFRSETQYTIANGDLINGIATIRMKVGADGNNTLYKPGYIVCNSKDGLSDGVGTIGLTYATYFGSCFSVTGGTTGDLVDFCNPQLTVADPPKVTDNDLLSFTFDRTVYNTQLNSTDNIYLCATAEITDSATGAQTTTEVCEQTAKSKMQKVDDNKFLITMWPREYFNLTTETQVVTRITYFITDATGTIKVGYNNTADAFAFRLKCE